MWIVSDAVHTSSSHIHIMVPFTSTVNTTAPSTTTSPSATPVPTATLNLTSSMLGDISTIIFGVIATLIGLVTVWKTHRTWGIWYHYHINVGNGDNNTPTRDDLRNLYELQQRGRADSGVDGDPLPAYTPDETAVEELPPAELHASERLSEHGLVDADEASSSPRR